MRKYDTTFIIDGSLDQVQREAIIKKFENVLTKSGADIERIVRWGLRGLAYEINKRSHGYYVIFYYHADPSIIKSFESEMKLNENILRYMTLVAEGKHPDYIKDESIVMESSLRNHETVEVADEEEIMGEELSVVDNNEIVEELSENDELAEKENEVEDIGDISDTYSQSEEDEAEHEEQDNNEEV
jgi:small subunit ribosomal protein S6